MTHADTAHDYQRANDVLDTLAGLLDTTRDQLPAGVGAFHRPEGLGVFLPLGVLERVLAEVGHVPTDGNLTPEEARELRELVQLVEPRPAQIERRAALECVKGGGHYWPPMPTPPGHPAPNACSECGYHPVSADAAKLYGLDADTLDLGARWKGRGSAARQTLEVVAFEGDLAHPQPLDVVRVKRTGGVSDGALGSTVRVALDQLVAAFEPDREGGAFV